MLARPLGGNASAAAIALIVVLVGAPAAFGSNSAAFTVPGSNGFSLDVESAGGTVRIVASEGRPPVPTFTGAGVPRPAAAANGAASIYLARGAGTAPGKLDVRLGPLGAISLDFQPSGRSRVTAIGPGVGLSCGEPVRIVRRLGTFVGTVEFEGEDGYTEVRATRVRGSVGTPLPSECTAAGASAARAGTGQSGPVVLRAVNRRVGTRFEAKKTAGGVAFLATWRERLDGGVLVDRRAYAGAPRASFSFDRRLTAARVAPPAPFSGVARFAAGARAPQRWTGSLRATFPGIAVPITGPGFRARIEGER